jgi:hypothetical protein
VWEGGNGEGKHTNLLAGDFDARADFSELLNKHLEIRRKSKHFARDSFNLAKVLFSLEASVASCFSAELWENGGNSFYPVRTIADDIGAEIFLKYPKVGVETCTSACVVTVAHDNTSCNCLK